jgi:hypothetical protein
VAVTNHGSQMQVQMEWKDMNSLRFFLKQRDSEDTIELVKTTCSLFDYGFRSDTIHLCIHVSILSNVQA